jgi:hypothetical protein
LRRLVDGWLACVLAALAAFAVAWWPARDLDAILANMDVLYHVHRVQRCLADFPHVASVDTYSHAGHPYHLHWSAAHDLVLAVVARLRGVGATADVHAILDAIAFVPVMLGACTAALVAVLARRATPLAGGALIAGLLVATSADALAVFHDGMVDHHAVTALGLVALALARMRQSFAGWIAACLFLLVMTPEATPYLTVMLGATWAGDALALAGGREAGTLQRARRFMLAPAACAIVAWLVNRALDATPPAWTFMSPFVLTAFQAAWLLALGACLGEGLVRASRVSGRRRLAWLLGGAGAAALAATATLALIGGIAPVIQRLTDPTRQQVGEEISHLAFLAQASSSHWAAWARLLLLALLAGIVLLVAAARRREGGAQIFLRVMLVVAPALALLELRHARALCGFVALGLAVATLELVALALRAPRARHELAALAGVLAAAVILPAQSWHLAELRSAIRATPTWPRTIGPLLAAMREKIPDAGPRDRPPPHAVMAQWEWGHHVNVLASQPVLVDGFNHEEGMNLPAREIWLAEASADLPAALERNGASWLATTNLASAVLGLHPLSHGPLAQARPDLPGGIAWSPEMRRFASFRFEEGGGIIEQTGRLRPLFLSRIERPLTVVDAGTVVTRSVPAARLHQLVAGAVITGTSTEAQVTATVEVEWGDPVRVARLRLPMAAGEGGRFDFRVALPAPITGDGFRVAAPWSVQAGERSATVVVTESDVATGAQLQVTLGSPGMP